MKEVNVMITLGDAADIHFMIEKEISSVELKLEQILEHGNSASEEQIKMLKNRIESFKKLQKKFDL